MNSLRKKDFRAAILMLSPFLIFFALFVLYPLLVNFRYSFTNYNLNTASFVGLKNFDRLFRDDTFLKACQNTFLYAFVSVVSLSFLGLVLAAMLSGAHRGVKWLRMLFLFPYATSMTAISMIWLMMLDPNHGFVNKALRFLTLPTEQWLFDPELALGCLIFINVWKNLGYCMLIYLSGIHAIPEELYDAAKVDGAGPVARFFSVTLPSLRPVIFFVFITTMVDGFKTFEQVQVMTRGDPMNATTTIVHQIYLYGFSEFRMGYAAAMAVVLLLTVMLITFVNYRINRTSETEVYGE
ncbi:MAG: sugar ABC transporter permease [Clostridia bacterium]|nr:sugar ABC transporter permease [Clostridia bacterium]